MEIFFIAKINTEIIDKCFKYQNPTFLFKDLYETNKNRNGKIVNLVSDALKCSYS